MPRAVTSIPFTDIARTEVLKGPQGTLFGRNATAGVINIVPNKLHQEFEGFVKARLGTNDLVRVEGMVNTLFRLPGVVSRGGLIIGFCQ